MAKYVLADGDAASTFLAGFNNNSTKAYALDTGISGGQTLIGSTLTNEDLSLRGNAINLTTGSVNVLDSLEASSKTVGALTVAGGLAVAKKLYAGATTLDSLSVGSLGGVIKGTAGALSAATAGTDFVVGSTGLAGGQTVAGGTLTTENLTLRGNATDTTTGSVIVSSSKVASSKTVGAVQVAGGVAIAKELFAGATTIDSLSVGTLTGVLKGATGTVSAATAGTDYAAASTGVAGGQTIAGGTLTTQNLTLQPNAADTTTGQVIINSTLTSSSKSTGSLKVLGGAGIAGPTFAAAVTADSVSIGVASPTADLHIKAGSATASTAPIKLTSGTLMTNAEAGAIEFLTDKLYFSTTTGPTRKEVAFYDSFYGGFYVYDKSATMIIPIDTANTYHVIRSITASDVVTGLLAGFTFNQGRLVDADIANIKDGAGGRLQIECSTPHLLSTGDVIAISKENRVAGNNMITKITYVDATQFTCDQIAYAGGTQTSTAAITEPAYLQASAGSTGVYHASFTCAFTATNARVIKMEVNAGATAYDNIAAERTATGTEDTFSSSGNISVTAGDRIFVSCKNAGGVEDITISQCNLNLHRI